MNWVHHNLNRPTDNELICTACSPEWAGEKQAGNTNKPMKPRLPALSEPELFTGFGTRNPGGEEVCVSENQKKRRPNKKAARGDGLFNFTGTRCQDAFGAAGLFFQAAAFLRFR
jgi:hypothetical protein